jgi:hypothetical protein
LFTVEQPKTDILRTLKHDNERDMTACGHAGTEAGMLHEFVTTNRVAIIVKTAERQRVSQSPSLAAGDLVENGVPRF